MARVVRASKFRHVFGQATKKADGYDGIRVTKNAVDSTFCSVNPKFLAVITEAAGGGAFIVLPLEKVGRVERETPLVSGHRGAVTDIAWCPHNDNIIASGSDDCSVKIWVIPDGGIKETLVTAEAELLKHQRRVSQVLWHPSAQNVLLSAGADLKIFIWDIARAQILSSIECHTDAILSVSWNYDGSRFVTSSKDKMFRVIDARSGEVLHSGTSHASGKPARAIYLRDGRIFSTGFSKMAERQYAVWDEGNLGTPLTMNEIDSSNGILFPFYDEDTNIIYLCGKGDSNIRYFEYTPDEAPYIHFLNQYSSNEPQRGIGFMPKRGLNIKSCEIARFYKLLNSGLCEAISLTVPRKSDLFQDDLYPDTAAGEYAITDEEWADGINAGPKLIPVLSFLKAGSPSKATFSSDSDTKPNDDSTTPKKPNLGMSKSFRMPSRPTEISQVEPLPVKPKQTVPVTSNGSGSSDSSHDFLKENSAKLDQILSRMNAFERRLEALEAKLAPPDESESSDILPSQF